MPVIFLSLQNIHYAFVDPVPSSTEAPAPLGDTSKVVYSAVRPHVGSLGKSEERCNNDTTSATSAHSATNAHVSWLLVFHWGFFNVVVYSAATV